MNKKGLLIVVSGPSGAGKGTICKEVLSRRNDIFVSTSATTREPRDGEVHGVNYFFVSREEFEKKIEEEAFIEYAEVYTNLYGTPKDTVLEKLNKGENILLEIDIQGALQVKKRYPEGVFIFILPPSMEELKNRIIGRGSETPESLERRFSSAFEEIEFVNQYDYYIINDQVKKASDLMEAIIDAERCKVIEDIEDIVKMFKEEG
ncbi:guanylate kinase [Acidaminobacter sp. JC074]|uniref:guanylate kinase n=1 Tax=Acidaminobacter sp. JC074 TaxID=2530199 RepID=UPI001F105EE7|nr:guanylate kinase [Acidaminobacter sp. JC074]